MVIIEDSSTKEVHRGAPSITECLVNGLLPGRQYSFKVQVYNRVGVSVCDDFVVPANKAGENSKWSKVASKNDIFKTNFLNRQKYKKNRNIRNRICG